MAGLNICSHKESAKQKIADLKETAKVDETLIKHYEFILANFDSIQEKLDDEIAVVQDQKDQLLAQFIEAPEKLIQLNKHLAEIKTKAKGVLDTNNGKAQKINRLKRLRERLAKMEKDYKTQGINID